MLNRELFFFSKNCNEMRHDAFFFMSKHFQKKRVPHSELHTYYIELSIKVWKSHNFVVFIFHNMNLFDIHKKYMLLVCVGFRADHLVLILIPKRKCFSCSPHSLVACSSLSRSGTTRDLPSPWTWPLVLS